MPFIAGATLFSDNNPFIHSMYPRRCQVFVYSFTNIASIHRYMRVQLLYICTVPVPLVVVVVVVKSAFPFWLFCMVISVLLPNFDMKTDCRELLFVVAASEEEHEKWRVADP